MRDRAGFFAGLSDSLTAMCAYYVVAGLFITGKDNWGVHLVWPLLCASACALLLEAFLRKPRSTAALTAATGGLGLASLGVFALVSRTPLYFGYGFVLAVGAGMAVGVPLYHLLHRPTVQRHLAHLDALILLTAVFLLIREALGIGVGAAALMAAVLLMDAAGAVGLRMSDGEQDAGSAFRGTVTALAAAAALALVIWLLTAVFSRSGSVTGGVLGALGAFFAAVGGGIERFFARIAALASPTELDGAVIQPDALPSVAAVEVETAQLGAGPDNTALGVALVIAVLAAAAVAVILLRKKSFRRKTADGISAPEASVRRTGGTAAALFERLRRALRLRLAAFMRRDTPGGLLVSLERLGRRRHTPRLPGESMRHFIRRMDESGGLDALSDALDAEYYGGTGRAMSAGQCRELRKYMRKAVQHG